jgi:hypothetical protein
MAMQWFGRDKPREPWDEEIVWPIGDIEAADLIRRICRLASEAAAIVARPSDGKERRSETRLRKSETERYERAAKCAMEIALKVKDDLMRDAAIREIVELCLKANDLKTAQILLRAIQSEAIREDVLNANPVLRG